MKTLLQALALALLLPASLFAQDVLVIEAQYDVDGLPVADVIPDAIDNDTTDAGEQIHDVYMLEAGELYTITREISLRSPVTLTAPEMDIKDADMMPPQIRVKRPEECAPTGTTFILAHASVEISNIYFGSMNTCNQLNFGNLVIPMAEDISITMNNVINDYLGWSMITNTNPDITGVSYYLDNFYAKNGQNLPDVHTPFFLFSVAPIDTLSVKNTTYFQSHGYFLQARVPINYLEVDHSTIANLLKIPILNESLTNAKITNNVFYNTEASGWTRAGMLSTG